MVKVGNKPLGRLLAMLMARPWKPTRIAECLVRDEIGPSYLPLVMSKVTTHFGSRFFGCEMENRGKVEFGVMGSFWFLKILFYLVGYVRFG